MRMSSVARIVVAPALCLSLLLVASSAWAYGASGQILNMKACRSATANTIIVQIQTGAGPYWYTVSDGVTLAYEANERLATAAFLAGKSISINHNGAAATHCTTSVAGSILFTGGSLQVVGP